MQKKFIFSIVSLVSSFFVFIIMGFLVIGMLLINLLNNKIGESIYVISMYFTMFFATKFPTMESFMSFVASLTFLAIFLGIMSIKQQNKIGKIMAILGIIFGGIVGVILLYLLSISF